MDKEINLLQDNTPDYLDEITNCLQRYIDDIKSGKILLLEFSSEVTTEPLSLSAKESDKVQEQHRPVIHTTIHLAFQRVEEEN